MTRQAQMRQDAGPRKGGITKVHHERTETPRRKCRTWVFHCHVVCYTLQSVLFLYFYIKTLFSCYEVAWYNTMRMSTWCSIGKVPQLSDHYLPSGTWVISSCYGYKGELVFKGPGYRCCKWWWPWKCPGQAQRQRPCE